MKKFLIGFMVLCLVFLCACNSAATDSPETTAQSAAPSETQPATEETQATTAPVALTEDEIYDAILEKMCKRLNKIIGDDTHLDGLSSEEGMLGVSEIASLGGTELLNMIGYTVFDINGDGVKELLICKVDELSKEACTGTLILCAYTVSDNAAELLLEGASRNRYYYLDNATFYNEGSNGAAHSIFATYSMAEDSRVLTCVDYYFTDLDENQQMLLRHNQTGIFQDDASVAFEGSEDDFWNISKELAEQIQTIDLLPLSAFSN